MAVTTRFYPNFSGAAFQPSTARGAWDKTSDADPPCQLSRTKSGTEAVTTTTETVATNNYDSLWEILVTDAFTAPVSFTASDTLQWVLGVLENNAGANAFWHVYAYITAGSTNTVRGVVLSDNIGATEFTTTLTGRGEGTKALGSVSAQVGDRLVVEIGVQFQNTVTTSFSAQVALQGTGGTDLTQGSTSVTTQPGWIELVTSSDPYGITFSITGTGAFSPQSASNLSISGVGDFRPTSTSSFATSGTGLFSLVSASTLGIVGPGQLNPVSTSSFGITGTGTFNPIVPSAFVSFSIQGSSSLSLLSSVRFDILGTGIFNPVPQGVAVTFAIQGSSAVNFISQAPFAWVPVTPGIPNWSATIPSGTAWTEQPTQSGIWTPDGLSAGSWTPTTTGSSPWTKIS